MAKILDAEKIEDVIEVLVAALGEADPGYLTDMAWFTDTDPVETIRDTISGLRRVLLDLSVFEDARHSMLRVHSTGGTVKGSREVC